MPKGSESKHTPGPWKAVDVANGNEGLLIRAAKSPYGGKDDEPAHANICYLATPYGRAAERGPRCHDLKSANARLMVASPDLLDFAADSLIAFARDGNESMVKAAKAVITKATEPR